VFGVPELCNVKSSFELPQLSGGDRQALAALPRIPNNTVSTILNSALATSFCINMAASVDTKLLRQTKFPPEFNQKVDMNKVNVEVMKK
jgi:hypothetical protein